jgi:hypothetical protein
MSRLMRDPSPGTYVLNPDTSSRTSAFQDPEALGDLGPYRARIAQSPGRFVGPERTYLPRVVGRPRASAVPARDHLGLPLEPKLADPAGGEHEP